MTTVRKNGFTLIEMLIAIAIFAIMSAFAYRALSSILTARDRVTEENQKWRSVSSAFARIEADFTNIAGRTIRTSSNLTAAAVVGNLTYNNDNEGQIMFTRMGLPGANGSLAAPQRLGYRLKNGTLEELVWPVLDQAPRTVPAVYPLLTGVSSFTLAYYDGNRNAATSWPPANSPLQTIPVAVKVELTLDSGESMSRLLLLKS